MELKMQDELNEKIIKRSNDKLKREQNKLLIGFAVVFFVGYVFFFTSNIWMPRSYEDVRVTKIGSVVEANDRKVTLISWSFCEEQHLMEVVLDISNASIDGIEKYNFTAFDRNEGMCEVTKVIDTPNFVVLQIRKVPSRWTELSLRLDADSSLANQATADFTTMRFYTSKRVVDRVDDITVKSEKEYRLKACELKIKGFNDDINNALEEIKELDSVIAQADERIVALNQEIEFQTASEKTETLNQISNIEATKETAIMQKQGKESDIRELEEKIEKQNELKKLLQKGEEQ